MEYCACNNGNFMLTNSTSNQPRIHQPSLANSTYRAFESIRPPQSLDKIDAGTFRRKPLIKFLQDARLHFFCRYPPFLSLKINFPPFGLPQFARSDKDQRGQAQGAPGDDAAPVTFYCAQ
jgi:hypothetical protein